MVSVSSGKPQSFSSGKVGEAFMRRQVGSGKATYRCAPCDVTFATDELIKVHVAEYHSV